MRVFPSSRILPFLSTAKAKARGQGSILPSPLYRLRDGICEAGTAIFFDRQGRAKGKGWLPELPSPLYRQGGSCAFQDLN
uniref:Uncharacterized protein n=1 Tax=Picea glauca TaxID=3330 RepID=A0A101LUY4_PICGL|nr:hypothetical protein ABT39_MTgene2191 [Picea glauca]